VTPEQAVSPEATRPSEELDVSYVSEGLPVSGKFFTARCYELVQIVGTFSVIVL